MGSRVRPTERSSGQRSSSGREEMGCRSALKRQHLGAFAGAAFAGAFAGPETAAFAGALARLETGEAAGMGDFAGDLFRRKKGCQGYDNSISARWEIGADLVGCVSSGGRCRDIRWTGVDDKICTRPEAVETCCRLTARREFALSKLL
ncbi:hypothetical protein BHM03_00020836 [Ensete ventricosum]|nr:hypothetical protein BHM03_00020836 [Ensete ventricosum]